MMNTENTAEYYLWLLQVMGVANPRSIRLIKHFGSAEQVYRKIESGENDFLKEPELIALKSATLERSAKIMDYCAEAGIKIITFYDDDYPELLRNIYNPPVLLFTEGDISCINNSVCLTVIGTRTPSEYSVKVAEIVSKKLAELGMIIISGFALGIDKSAQMSALAAGGKTVGVLACGIDVDYPRGSISFRKKVALNGGAAISELLPGSKTDRGYFHFRNRIMSGLSQGTLIVEAGYESGCHITADYAVNQNRDLFCVPPANVFLERYSGVVRYLRDGAIPVFSYVDIVRQYKSALELKLHRNSDEYDNSAEDNENFYDGEKSRRKNKEKSAEKREKSANSEILRAASFQPEKPPPPDYSSLSQIQKDLVEILKDGAKTLDFMAQNSKYDLNSINCALLDLELDGIAESLPGSQYKLK